MTKDNLTPEQETLTKVTGYFIDLKEEEKYLIRDDGSFIGPTEATEAELNMWIALETQGLKRLTWMKWTEEMVRLRAKFHSEHMLDKADSDKLDELIVNFGKEFLHG